MIAKGGMAEVYRAKTTGFQGFEKEVCVKKILPHLTEDENFVNMFINEAKLAATLSFANIVQVHDLCVSAGGDYFIVMEYVSGKDLSDVIRAAQLAGKEIPPELVVVAAREVCQGLGYAHAKTDTDGAPLNIIHRDISPHNVLVSYMGECKITDFGIAKASSIVNKTAVGILKGKYGYMSPEQARGLPLDHRSDIFNTGILLYELLVGERCFAGSSDFSTLNLMRNAEVTPPTSINTQVPRDLEAIVLKALAKERDDRYQDAFELDKALATWAQSSGKMANKADLGAFVRELFKEDKSKKVESTGILDLKSVAGPPPKDEKEQAKNEVKPRRKTERAPELADQKVQEAKKSAEQKEAKQEKKPVPEKAAKKTTAEKKPPVAAETRKPPVKKTPARIRKDAAPAKKKGKQLHEGPKKPVGRKHLRPGLTRIQKLQANPTRRVSWVKVSIPVAASLFIGLGIGIYRAKSSSQQHTFRLMETENRGKKVPGTNMVYIETEPAGATVRLDDVELSGKTPLAIDRDQDKKKHSLVLRLGDEEKKLEFTADASGLTRVKHRFEKQAASLKLSGLDSVSQVSLAGREITKTETVHTPGNYLLIYSRAGERHQQLVVLRAGKTVDIDLSSTKELAVLRIESTPEADVYLDGKRLGRKTSEGALYLAPDKLHRLELKRGKKLQKLSVTLKKGEAKTLLVEL